MPSKSDQVENNNDVKILVIIPARSGSKGVVDKNIRSLLGKPLIQWTVDAVNDAKLVDSVILLSTDSSVYAELGRDMGLVVPFLRPADCASDNASALQVIEHALGWFKQQYRYLPAFVMWLQPTSPFRPASTIQKAVSLVNDQRADAVIGCKEIYRDLTTLFRCEDGLLRALDSERVTQTSRQQQPLLTPNGAMYLCKADYLLEHKSFYPPKTVPLVMNAIQSLDIDSEEDWAMAEAFILHGLVS
ncbi:acylneuraminate cytidylyltransferase family protein [Methylomonas sp. YC3]